VVECGHHDQHPKHGLVLALPPPRATGYGQHGEQPYVWGVKGRPETSGDFRLMFSPFLLLSLLPALNVFAQEAGLLKLYAPATGSLCPDIAQNPLLREFTAGTQALHPRENAYVHARESTVIPTAWQDWLGNGSQIGYDVSALSKNLSRIGIAFSGGGFRAAQYAAGVTSALDARNSSAKSAGTGGLLQVASYISGLSGKLDHPSAFCV
jgi:lysophospholipase